jgi:hypothetical protein
MTSASVSDARLALRKVNVNAVTSPIRFSQVPVELQSAPDAIFLRCRTPLDTW